MEAVITAALATQAALYALERRAARRPPPQAPPRERAAAASSAAQPAERPTVDASPNGRANSVGRGLEEPAVEAEAASAAEVADEEVNITPATVRSMEAEIAALRAKATYTSDTLVAASRADRRANELAAKLRALKAAQAPNARVDTFEALQRLGFNVPPGMAGVAGMAGVPGGLAPATAVRRYAGAGTVRAASFLALYLYFWLRGDRYVIRLPCDALRPLAWFLSTRTAGAETCPLLASAAASCRGDVCAVSYYLFAMLAGAVVQLLVRTAGRARATAVQA